MMMHHSKEFLLNSLQGSVIDGYKRKKQKVTREEDDVIFIPDTTLVAEAEMDIDSGDGEFQSIILLRVEIILTMVFLF